MAFGKRSTVSEDLSKHSIILLGESGVGKTTTLLEACTKEFGEDGYLFLDTGKEDGFSEIEGALYEPVHTWSKFEAVCKDIIENKETEYPDLKVVVVDTLDQLIEITEPEAIDRWNKFNKGKKDKNGNLYQPVKTLNQCWGGFGKEMDYVSNLILQYIWKLKKVGVGTWFTAHTKSREIVDPLTSSTYTTLSTNMATKYFNAFKTKVGVVGVACIDRSVEVEKTNRRNVVSRKDITVNKVKDERRIIKFRDDNYGVDSKSRFKYITDEIYLDADELIKALKDAIRLEKESKGGVTKKAAAPKKAKAKVEEELEVELDESLPIDTDDIQPDDQKDETEKEEDLFTEDEEVEDEIIDREAMESEVKDMYKKCKDTALKKEIRSIIKAEGATSFDGLTDEKLKSIHEMLNN